MGRRKSGLTRSQLNSQKKAPVIEQNYGRRLKLRPPSFLDCAGRGPSAGAGRPRHGRPCACAGVDVSMVTICGSVPASSGPHCCASASTRPAPRGITGRRLAHPEILVAVEEAVV